MVRKIYNFNFQCKNCFYIYLNIRVLLFCKINLLNLVTFISALPSYLQKANN